MTAFVDQTASDLNKQLICQLKLIESQVNSYDSGLHESMLDTAVKVRLLFHNTSKSHSLIGQLHLANLEYCSTVDPLPFLPNTVTDTRITIGCYFGLVATKDYKFYPYLGSGKSRLLNLDEYWNEVIIVDQKNRGFTRRDLVLSLANQDGGAHVGQLKFAYRALTKDYSTGVIADGIELASMRQIAHEVLHTFKDYYVANVKVDGDLEGTFSCPVLELNYTKNDSKKKSGRNDPCPCGSGKKYKKCCGK